jgi:tetratricopeptide (TPR) repeat protein
MSVQTATNRFIVSPLQAVWAGLYQHLFSPAVSFQEFGNRLVRYAEHAQAIRQVERVQEAGQLLANFPLKEYQSIGQYYLAWCDYRNGIDNRETLEHVAEYGPMIYRARALQSLAAIEARKQDYASELRWLIESMKVHPTAEAWRGIAIVKAKEGYHRSAVKDFESLHRLAQHSEPVSYLQYL